jgi:hypothetical protein
MQRFWSTFRELSEALPIRRILTEHALLIGVGVVVLVLCFAYPKLLIPLLGLGLPLYAGGLILKSMFDDRREASEFALLQRNAAIALREAINEKTVVNLPVLGDTSLSGLAVRVTGADDQGIETIDVVTKQPARYSWNEINLELFCWNLAQHIRPADVNDATGQGARDSSVSWIKAISSAIARRGQSRN